MIDTIHRINVTLPESYLAAIDQERGDQPRSEFIREVLRRGRLRKYQLTPPPETRGRKRGTR